MKTAKKSPELKAAIRAAAKQVTSIVSPPAEQPAETKRPPHPGETRGRIAIADIRPSPENPPGRIGDVSDLVESVRASGVMQDIVVRPVGDKAHFTDRWHDVEYFEIIAGHRRFGAAKEAGLRELFCKVWPVTADEAADLRLVENDQRKDLKPSEKAAAYKSRRDAGRTDEQIAEAVGMPLGFVKSILALAKLPTALLEAVDDGTVPRSVADIVARIPGDESRKLAAAHVLAGQQWVSKSGEKPPKPTKESVPLTHRQTRDLITRHFQIELKSATFSRKALDLLDGVGSCEACPKMAGNAAKTDPEYKAIRADVCLDPACFRAKTEAGNKRALAAAKASGKAVLPAKEADKIFRDYGDRGLEYNAPYVDLETTCYDAGNKKYKTLLKEHADKIVVAVDGAGRPRELMPKAVAAKILRDEHGVGMKANTPTKSPNDAKDAREVKLWNAIRLKCQEQAAALVGRDITSWTPTQYEDALKGICTAVAEDHMGSDCLARVAKRRVGYQIASMSGAEALALVAEACVASALYAATYFKPDPERFGPLLSAIGIDYAQVRKEAEAEIDAPKKKPAPVGAHRPEEPKPATAGGDPAEWADLFDAADAKPAPAAARSTKSAEQELQDLGFLPLGPIAAKPVPQPTGPLVCGKVGRNKLSVVEGLDAEVIAALGRKGVHTLAELAKLVEPELTPQKNSDNSTRFATIGALTPIVGYSAAQAATTAILEHLHPDLRAARIARTANTETPPEPEPEPDDEGDDDSPAGNVPLSRVVHFPPRIALMLERLGIKTVADLEARVEKESEGRDGTLLGMEGIVRQTITKVTGMGGDLVDAAAEALAAYLLFGGEVPERACRVCGCTEDDCRQCIKKTGKPCSWVEEDLCSACVVPAPAAEPVADLGDGELRGEPIAGMKVTPAELDRASIVGKWSGKHAGNPVEVSPVFINNMPYIVTAKVGSEKGQSWYCVPLWTKTQFENRHPGKTLYLDPRANPDVKPGGSYYLGTCVVVKNRYSDQDYVIGANGEERRLIAPAKGRAKKGAK